MHARIFLAFFLSLMASAADAQEAATIVFASGNAQIAGRAGQLRAATRGGDLGAGETVETSDGRVQLRFRDGASLSLQPETRFRVDEFRFVEQDGKAGDDDRGFFSLLKGGFRTLTGLIGKERREQYKVDTAVATIGIRGTDYGVKQTEAGLTLSTFGGLVELCNDAGCVLVAPGETFFVAERNTLPRRDAPATGSLTGVPVIPVLPAPNTVELPGALLPGQGPPAPGPHYSPPTAP